jgi:hypothetical protein
MRALVRLVGAVLVLSIAIPTILAFLTLEDRAQVTHSRAIDAGDYDRAEKLIRRSQYALAGIGPSNRVTASQDDLDSLAAFLAHSLDGLNGTVKVTSEGVRVLASYETPHNPIGRYVNLAMTVRQSSTGLDIAALDLGRIHLGPRLARPAINLAATIILGGKLGDDVIGSVAGLSVAGREATLTIRPDATIEDRFKERVTDVAIIARPPAVEAYYRRIMEIASHYNQHDPVPFVDFLQPLLIMARDRSAAGDSVSEMHAMVFALAIYFGGDRLDRLRDMLLPRDLSQILQYTDYVVVRGRHDHVQHFIVSAAFTMSGGVGFTTTIGEAKEFDDLLRGGADFSFQDIAADRAGITFARIAETADGAAYLQSLGGRTPSEDLFFPVVHDLPEDMSPRRFNSVYHDTESAAFKAMIAEIDRRIHNCAAYEQTN